MKLVLFYFSCFLLIVAGIFIIGLFFYWTLIHPIWSMIDAVASDIIASESRVLWIVVIVFTWTLGSVLYSYVGTKSNTLRKSTTFSAIASLTVLLVLIGSGILAIATSSSDWEFSDWKNPPEVQVASSNQQNTSSSNTSNTKSECLKSAKWMFSHDAVNVCKNPTPYTSECLQSATWMFSHDAVTVCQNAKVDTAKCVAQSSSMFSHDAVKTCGS
ncbi:MULTISPECIES: hypothetical protein [unclassified Microcoleus]|uniref:hypothetical protein n=1 Tax=unclassified Microcoleus TaxID=2642155 RepID=UPI002FD2C9A8